MWVRKEELLIFVLYFYPSGIASEHIICMKYNFRDTVRINIYVSILSTDNYKAQFKYGSTTRSETNLSIKIHDLINSLSLKISNNGTHN